MKYKLNIVVSIFVFILIFNLIIPSKNNTSKLSKLENILPGITSVYDKDAKIEKKYKFKVLEIIDKK